MTQKSSVIIPPKPSSRDTTIDYLRGIAILVMILTHSLVPYLNNTSLYQIWNWSHFSVPVLVYCSAYLFFAKQQQFPPHPLTYFMKRVSRLITPFYVYLGALLGFMIITQQHISVSFVAKSLFLIGGADISWLVLLFVIFAVLLPIFAWIRAKNMIYIHLIYAVSFISSIILLWFTPSIQYKWYFFVPWASIIAFSFYAQKKQNNQLVPLFSSLLFCLISFCILHLNHHSTDLFQNKYPPNLFYLSYGVFMMQIIIILSKSLLKKNKTLSSFIFFFSTYSYGIFFIHYLLLTVLVYFKIPHFMPWPMFFLGVLGLSYLFQKALVKYKKYITIKI